MSKKPVRVAVTGAAGQIGYAILFRIASGEMLGKDQPVLLSLLEVPMEKAQQALQGEMMELEDCAFPLLAGMQAHSDPMTAFKDVDYALLIGSRPRGPGMERAELLAVNAEIFTAQGKALNAVASRDVRVLVVGNPCNTNCLIAMNNARQIPADRWFAMTRLDENRAKSQLARKAGVEVSKVTNLAIWGNHSATQYPDFFNAKIAGRAATDVITDHEWLKTDFIRTVQQRGAAIIKARGASSAASAANAVVDTVRSIETPTPAGDWHSVAICSQGDYGIEKGLITSFPMRTLPGGGLEVVKNVEIGEFSRSRIDATVQELKEERDLVRDLLG